MSTCLHEIDHIESFLCKNTMTFAMDLIWSLIASERFWNLRQLWASPPLPCPWNMLARTKGHVFCSTLLVILSCESPFQTLLELISMCSACVCWDMWPHSGFLDMDTVISSPWLHGGNFFWQSADKCTWYLSSPHPFRLCTFTLHTSYTM